MEEALKTLSLSIMDVRMILIGIVLFCAYWKLSEKFLFGPLLSHYIRREKATTGAKSAATELLEEAALLQAGYDAKIDAARAEAAREKMEAIASASREASEVVGKAEMKAKESIAESRRNLATLEQKLRSDLNAQADTLAKQLSEKIISDAAGDTTGNTTGTGRAASYALCIFGSIFFFLSPETAFAGGGPGHVPSFSDTLVYWPNFIAFVALLFFLLRKPFMAFWGSRVEEIESAVNAGKIAWEEAEKALGQVKDRVMHVDSDVKELTMRIQNEGRLEAKRIGEEASTKSTAILKRAEDTSESERNTMESLLQEELSLQVVEKAKKILQEDVTAEKDHSIRGNLFSGAAEQAGRLMQ